MKLNDITNYIQSICQNISTVLDVDVTVVSKDLIRIAGTGIFENKVSEKIMVNLRPQKQNYIIDIQFWK